jgi:hypothetical protein
MKQFPTSQFQFGAEAQAWHRSKTAYMFRIVFESFRLQTISFGHQASSIVCSGFADCEAVGQAH